MTTLPAGFAWLSPDRGFLGRVGGLCWRPIANGAEVCVNLRPEHLNDNGTAHGGLLMTVLDMTLGLSTHGALGIGPGSPHPATIQVSASLLGPARGGELLVGVGVIDGQTRRMSFVSARLRIGERLIATASAVFRNPSVPRAGGNRAES